MASRAVLRSLESRRDVCAAGTLKTNARGFTLVEVLVALAILAVALAAGFRSVAQSADGATALKARTLALWVAQNQLAAAQVQIPPPGVGDRSGRESQAGADFVWHGTISATPNPAFLKIEVTVADPAAPTYELARLVGYISKGVRE
jgi:general secretion pathway protein I